MHGQQRGAVTGGGGGPGGVAVWRAPGGQVSSMRGDVGDADAKLPTCRTCHNYLYLPPYTAPAVLEQRLDLAMWEDRIVFD